MKITKKGFWYVLHTLLHERFQREGFDTSQQKNEKRNPPKISIIYILPICKPHTSQLLVKNCKIVENNAKNSLCKRCVASALNAAKC